MTSQDYDGIGAHFREMEHPDIIIDQDALSVESAKDFCIHL